MLPSTGTIPIIMVACGPRALLSGWVTGNLSNSMRKRHPNSIISGTISVKKGISRIRTLKRPGNYSTCCIAGKRTLAQGFLNRIQILNRKGVRLVTKTMRLSGQLLILCSSHLLAGRSYSQTGPVAQFRFDGNIDSAAGSSVSGSAVTRIRIMYYLAP